MAQDPVAFDLLIKSIVDESFRFATEANLLDLSDKGLTDFDVMRLMLAVNANDYVYKNLKGLNLSNNTLTLFPELGKCDPEHLLLSNNQISIVPDLSDKKVSSLNLEGNPLINFPNLAQDGRLQFCFLPQFKPDFIKYAVKSFFRHIKCTTVDRPFIPNFQQDLPSHMQDYATAARRALHRSFAVQNTEFYTAYVCLMRLSLHGVNVPKANAMQILEYLVPKANTAELLANYLQQLQACLVGSPLAKEISQYEQSVDFSSLKEQAAKQITRDKALIFSRIKDEKSQFNEAIHSAIEKARAKLSAS